MVIGLVYFDCKDFIEYRFGDVTTFEGSKK